MTPRFSLLLSRSKNIVLLIAMLGSANALYAQSNCNVSSTENNATYYINSQDINNSVAAIPAPTVASSEDLHVSQEAIVSSTEEQITEAKQEPDTIFSYSSILGDDFNDQRLPLTAALFKKVDQDVATVLNTAKNTFQRQGPHGGKFSYPSQHSARAVLWAALLSDVFPDKKDLLTKKALQKSWNRVILGFHYPSDTYAGGVCGTNLKQLFLSKPAFQAEWNNACAEIKGAIPQAPSQP